MIKRLVPYFKERWLAFTGALIAMALVAPLTAGAMWILKQVVDKALLQKDAGMLSDIVLLVLALYGVNAILSSIHDFLTSYVGMSVVKTVRDQVYARLHELSMDFFTATDSARLIQRLTSDAQLLQNALNKMPVMVIRDGLTIIALT